MEIYEEIYEKLVHILEKSKSKEELALIKDAYTLAVEAHSKQFRKSGEPYIIHPIEVGIILAEMEVDTDTIIAGLLHDVIEDTKYTYSEIEKRFSKDVAEMVEGVTKLVELQYISKKEEQAENYRKLFVAMSMDVRVVLIKISDRLHNMRTLEHMPRHKQIEKSEETIEVYAPLAHRLGISKLRYELEDLAFKYLYPSDYEKLMYLLNKKELENKDYINNLHLEIKEKLKEMEIESDVESRVKHAYSVYKKMRKKNKSVEQIYDLIAVRILVNDVKDCYSALGVLHEMYKPLIGRFKDYIAVPKGNMYQSIHNTLLGPNAQPFEVQIRTIKMHKIAENGIAAHWKYKTESKINGNKNEVKLDWIKEMLEMQNEIGDNEEYLDTMKVDLELFNERVYCFTPAGDLLELPRGSTPLDFAYYIHSVVGDTVVGAKVDGRMVPFEYSLQNGERVELITNKNSHPSRDWLKIVQTTNAKSKIKQWFKKNNRDENIVHGKILLENESRKKGYSLQELLTVSSTKLVLEKYDFKEISSLYSTIGYGGLKEGQVVNRLVVEHEKISDNEKEKVLIEKYSSNLSTKIREKKGLFLVKIKGYGITDVSYAKCCNPILGDDVIAYVTVGKGYSLHKSNCHNIINLPEKDKNRVQQADWVESENIQKEFIVTIKVTAFDRHDLIMDIMSLLSTEKVKVSNVNAKVVNEKAILLYEIEVTSKKEVQNISNKIKNIKDIYDVERTN